MKTEEELGALLLERGWTVGTAESCTGGRIASRLTSIALKSVTIGIGAFIHISNA